MVTNSTSLNLSTHAHASAVVTNSSNIGRYLGQAICGNLQFNNIDKLNERISQEPKNAHRITKAFQSVAGIVGWGTWISQIALTGSLPIEIPAVIDPEGSIMENSSYGLAGFSLSSTFGLKLNFHDYKAARKINDKEAVNYRIAEVAINIFSVIGGVFFVLAKFATEGSIAFGTSILALPFYGLSYGIDIAKKSHKAYQSGKLQKELNAIIGNKDDLEDPEKLRASLQLLLDKITVTKSEKQLIENEVILDKTLENDSQLKKQEVERRYENLLLSKYKSLERKIGKDAACDFRNNVKDALNGLQGFTSDIESAKSLIEKIQKGMSSQIRRHLITIITEIVALSIFVSATIVSGGGVAPFFMIL